MFRKYLTGVGGAVGVLVWVLTLGAKGEVEHASTQRIKLTLQPVDPETGEDAQISETRRGLDRTRSGGHPA